MRQRHLTLSGDSWAPTSARDRRDATWGPGRPSAGRERTGAWRGGFLLGALEVALKEDLRRHLRTVQQLNLSLDLIGIDWTRMWLQADGNYGSVMITPDFLLRDCLNLVANLREPTELHRA